MRLKGIDAKRMLEADVVFPGLEDDWLVQVTTEQLICSIAVSLKKIAARGDMKMQSVLPSKGL